MPVTTRKLHAEGTCRVHYHSEAPYFHDAQAWYHRTVSPRGTLDEFLGYVIQVGTSYPRDTFDLFDGLGYMRCATRSEMASLPVAARYAQASKGFIVELPTLTLFTEDKQPTQQQPTLV